MRGARSLGMVVLVVSLAGCGSTSHEKKAVTRPAALFAKAPSGLRYKIPDPATVDKVKATLSKSASGLSGDDVAVRQVLQKGGLGDPVAFGVVVDSHLTGAPDDALNGFDEEAKKEGGSEAQHVVVAGTRTSLVKLSGTIATAAAKNGYVVEALSADPATAKLVLKRLIVAAGQAQR